MQGSSNQNDELIFSEFLLQHIQIFECQGELSEPYLWYLTSRHLIFSRRNQNYTTLKNIIKKKKNHKFMHAF